jgi:hypothetical protein
VTSDQFIAVGSVVSIIVSLVGCTAWVVTRMGKLEAAISLLAFRVQRLEDSYEVPVHHRRV